MTEINKPGVNVAISGSSTVDVHVEAFNVVQPPPIPVPPPEPPNTWDQLTPGLNSGLATANWRDVATDGQGNWVAVATEGWTAGSTDNGSTWSMRTRGLNSGDTNPDWRGVAALSNGVFVAVAIGGWASRSIDGGLTWTNLPRYLGIADMSSDFRRIGVGDNGTFFAVGDASRTSRSTDQGVTWTEVPRPLIGGFGSIGIRQPIYLGGNDWFIVGYDGASAFSTDNCASYGSFITPQGLNSGQTLANFETCSHIGQTIMVGARGGWASRSTDGGTTWVEADQWLNSGAAGVEVIYRIVNDGYTWMSSQDNGFTSISVDDGVTWTEQTPQGLNSGLASADFEGLATDGNGVWVAVAVGGWAARGTVT